MTLTTDSLANCSVSAPAPVYRPVCRSSTAMPVRYPCELASPAAAVADEASDVGPAAAAGAPGARTPRAPSSPTAPTVGASQRATGEPRRRLRRQRTNADPPG